MEPVLKGNSISDIGYNDEDVIQLFVVFTIDLLETYFLEKQIRKFWHLKTETIT